VNRDDFEDIFLQIPADWYDLSEKELKQLIDSELLYSNQYFNILKSSYLESKYKNIFSVKRFNQTLQLNLNAVIGVLPMQIWMCVSYHIPTKTTLFDYKSDFENIIYIDTHNTPKFADLLKQIDDKCLKLIRVFSHHH
jgi:hypothetical protein